MQLIAVGILLFGADHLLDRKDEQAVIRVDTAALTNYMQFTNRAFDAERFRTKFDELSAPELATLVDSFVTEEALTRRGRELGLDQNDYVARRRLVTQMKYLVDAQAEAAASTVSEDEIRRYFQNHPDEFATTGKISFDHVFFPPEIAKRAIERERNDLLKGADWRAAGHRFAYGRTVTRQTPQQIGSVFGDSFEAAIEAIPSGSWSDPIESRWGSHLVRVTAKEDGRNGALEDASSQIAEAISRSQIEELRRDELSSITDRYEIVVTEEVATRLPYQ